MLLPRKLIILAIFVHLVTIFACASFHPKEEPGKEIKEEQMVVPTEVNEARNTELQLQK